MKRSDILVMSSLIVLAPHMAIWMAVCLGAFMFGMAAWHNSRGD